MDLPPSGWYPDPYGLPGLLRWWDGTVWTGHTYAEAPAAAETTVDPAATAIEPAAVSPTTVEPVQDPLTGFGPPTGPRTEPQPALPQGYDATRGYDAAQGYDATRVYDGTQGYDGTASYDAAQGYDGTRVLTLDEYSEPPLEGTIWPPDGGGGGRGNRPARRDRRILLWAGLGAGVLAAFAVIAIVVSDMNSPSAPPAPVADPGTARATAVASAAPPASAAPSASPTPSATATSSITDAASGLAYGQLPAPWGPGCPASLTNAGFTWTAGESAVAGQVNNGQTTWYGVACSGALPAQYGYNGTGDLENVTNALVNAFNGTYYAALPHNFQPTQSVPVSVSGHPGWEITFLQTYTSPQPGMTWTNEEGAVVVTDPGNGGPPAVFYVSVPGNLNEGNVATLVSSLQFNPVPSPASSATTTAPATATPTPGTPTPGAPVPGAPVPGMP